MRLRTLDVPLARLPEELAGLRIAHLSDFHFGLPSRGTVAVERAIDWVEQRQPDLVAIPGDLVSRPRGEALLREQLGRLERPFVVLGNHDVAVTRDPFSRAAELDGLEHSAVLLRDDAAVVERGGGRIQVSGVDPQTFPRGTARPWELTDSAADLRILLCHFPDIDRSLPVGAFHLVLAGHLHAGQIAIPTPRGRITLAHPRERFVAGLYPAAGAVMHVSPGTGTTFVPLRFFARPEVTELVLRPAAARLQQSP